MGRKRIIEIVYHNSDLACVGDITGGAEHTGREILPLSIRVISPEAPIQRDEALAGLLQWFTAWSANTKTGN